MLPDKEPLKVQLLESLRSEWELRLPLLKGKKIVSIYFGGGTPYLFGPKAIETIIAWVAKDLGANLEDIEITLEANPENIESSSMRAYSEIGINRISIGIQSLDKALLHQLGRLHSAEKAVESVNIAYNANITNISVDLMYDLPGQTFDSWITTLNEAVKLPITHLSLYNLTIEPHTVFFKHRETLLKMLPKEEVSTAMYKAAQEILSGARLHQYEISAFAKGGNISRHNSGYWTGRSFLGFGPSAFGYWQKRRMRNVANLSKYSKQLKAGLSPVDYEEELSLDAAQRELLVINLRLIEGVDLREFEKQNGCFDKKFAKEVESLFEQGLLTKGKEGKICMTDKGILFYDTIASELI